MLWLLTFRIIDFYHCPKFLFKELTPVTIPGAGNIYISDSIPLSTQSQWLSHHTLILVKNISISKSYLTAEKARVLSELATLYTMDPKTPLEEAHDLNDMAEAYLNEMIGIVGPAGGNGAELSMDFTLGRGADLWQSLKTAREKAGRPEPKR